MTQVMIFIFAFLIGKYFEKASQMIKDWRMAQRFSKATITNVEYDMMKKQNEELKQILKNSNVKSQNYTSARADRRVPDDYYNMYEEEFQR